MCVCVFTLCTVYRTRHLLFLCRKPNDRNLCSKIILTYFMVQGPSWEASWFAASQEIPRISRNSMIHYRTHKRPPRVSILGQPNPVHIPTSHLLEIHPNVIHPSTPRSPHWSVTLRFPHQDPIDPPLLTHTLHMPSPSRSYFKFRVCCWNLLNGITNRCFWNACVTWQGIDYELPEDDTIVSKHVGVW